jgi:hypothetical protein
MCCLGRCVPTLPDQRFGLVHGCLQGPYNFACRFGVGWSVQNFGQLRFSSAFVIVHALVFAELLVNIPDAFACCGYSLLGFALPNWTDLATVGLLYSALILSAAVQENISMAERWLSVEETLRKGRNRLQQSLFDVGPSDGLNLPSHGRP